MRVYSTFLKEPLIGINGEQGDCNRNGNQNYDYFEINNKKPNLVVIELKTAFDITEKVAPACLPIKPIGPSMTFYPDFLLIFSNFYPDKKLIKLGYGEFLKKLDKI